MTREASSGFSKSTKGGAKWVEVLIPIEREATEFIRTEIEPIIGELFAKNFGNSIDSLPYVKSKG